MELYWVKPLDGVDTFVPVSFFCGIVWKLHLHRDRWASNHFDLLAQCPISWLWPRWRKPHFLFIHSSAGWSAMNSKCVPAPQDSGFLHLQHPNKRNLSNATALQAKKINGSSNVPSIRWGDLMGDLRGGRQNKHFSNEYYIKLALRISLSNKPFIAIEC